MLRIVVFSFSLFSIVLFSSCSKEDRQEVKQTIDSASQKLGHELDTIINTRLSNDSVFNNAPVETGSGSTLKSKEFRSALNDIFDKYEDIKDELADDDTSGTRDNTEQFKKVLKNTVTYAPAAEMNKEWKLWLSTTEKIIAEMSALTTLSEQRKKFGELTNTMEVLVNKFGLDKRTVYKLNCSALPAKTFWLTDSKELDNPYTGNDKSNGKDESCVRVISQWKFE